MSGSGRRAFLTGASSGIGAALAAELLRRGWRLGLAARNADALRKLACAEDPVGSSTRIHILDVTDTDALGAAVDRTAQDFGGLDAVIANAGIGLPGRHDDLSLDDVRRVFDVNVFAAIATLWAGLPHVRHSPAPLLAAVSSLAAWRGGAGAGPYNASKAALSNYLECLRQELAATDIRVLEINPGFVRTPMTDGNDFPMPFLVSPERAARSIADAIERRRSHLAFPRRAAFVMGLLRRMPDGMFDSLARRVMRRLARGGEPPPPGSVSDSPPRA